nr:PLP-dependent aminotransferase family protein [Stappia albiluteola]
MLLAGFLDLDRRADVALPEQIYRSIRSAVGDKRLATGDALPSSRALAAALDVSRNTVNAAYELLAAEGIIEVKPGARPRIAAMDSLDAAASSVRTGGEAPGVSRRGAALAQNARSEIYAAEAPSKGQLQPGSPAEDCFPRDDWARALRRAARRVSGGVLQYQETAGYPALRAVLAGYLARERGVRAKASQVLVLPSAQACLHLVTLTLSDPGDCAWLEDPGYLGARAAFLAAGLTIEPLPVDADGADVGAMATGSRPKLVYVTPSHQFPLGSRMALDRRLALLERARAAGAIILEDDYDSEFLFHGRPIAALQGLGSGEEVVYLGTFSKSMLPGLRIAYMVVPERLAGPLAQAQRNAGLLVNIHTQAALAEFIESGHYRAHLKRIRSTYEARGRKLVERSRARLGNRVAVEMPVGGVQLVARFGAGIDDRTVVERMAKKGYAVSALSGYGLAASLSGLVIGFAGATEGDIDAGISALADALDDR